jgi:hypothetical protein
MTSSMLNVNLKPCRCQEPKKRAAPCEPGHHRPECGGPVPIPCRLPPSVTLRVVLGVCDYPRDACRFGHLRGCAAYPLRVTCSIVSPDGSWEKSGVDDVDPSRGPDGFRF